MLIPHGTLILVVDGSRMQLLRNRGRDSAPDLELLRKTHLSNPRTHVMGSDEPGRSFAGVGARRGAHAATDLHQRREDEFGRKALDVARSMAGEASPLIIIAPPHMLGQLRDHRRAHHQPPILAEIDKDLTSCSETEIASYLHGWRP